MERVTFASYTASPLLLYAYLAAKAGRNQGGYDDHGDNDLDGGGNGSHVECIVAVCCLSVQER
jgi:hypothetical protein